MKKIELFLLVITGIFIISCSKSKNENPSQNNTQSIDQKVNELLAQMTLEEKVGQMTQVDRAALQNIDDIKNYYLGSLLSGGGSAPADNSPASWADMCDGYQNVAIKTRLKIPLIYGIDAVHGNNNVKGAVIFPHNIGMGCTWDPALVQKAARATAEEVAGTGINWTFSPCIAVSRNIRWGRTYESFGETPEIQQIMSQAEVLGYQGSQLSDGGASILACAKHYVGDGGTADGKDQGNTICDEATLRAIHLPGYISAIKAGVGSIMVSYSSWNGVKLSSIKYLLTDVLKTELGFKGFLVSDWGALYQLPGDFKTQIASAVNAGIDMVMVPTDYKNFIAYLLSDVQTGTVSIDRINDAVRRILKIKMELGLFDHPFANRAYTAKVGSAEHREIARECVRESLVLLKNNSALPLSKNLSKIFVAGSNADDLGNQCGGWTISWQGSSGNITTGTTILQAIKNAVSSTTQVTYAKNGADASGYDAAIVVIGETPYAEGNGDRSDLSISSQDYQTLVNVKNANIPTVVILVSGRPMILSNILDLSDAIVAAWLPGTEGEGVTDVIFGDYKPVGKLAHSWPKNMNQIPLNYGDQNYDPLFPYKYGLTY